MLREEQIRLRRQRAGDEKFRIRRMDGDPVYSDYRVRSLGSGRTYRVAIRGFGPGETYCECPDFRKNTLETCKHVEAVIGRIQRTTTKGQRARKPSVAHPEVYLRYGPRLEVRLNTPKRASAAVQGFAARHFDDQRRLRRRDGQAAAAMLRDLDELDEEVTVFGDAAEYLDRQMELDESLQEERVAVKRLAAGKLTLDLLKVPLYPYQTRGVLFAAHRGRVVLGDDMGLGKTVQAIAAAELLARRRGISKVLVVAPASVKYQWATEIARFCDRSVRIIEGTKKRRDAAYADDSFFKLVNYEAILRDVPEINLWGPDLIVLDEAQRIKNWATKTARCVKSLRSRYCLVMTGTPLENKIEELYSIVEFVDDRRLGPVFQFLHDHVKFDDKGKLTGYAGLDRVREMLEPIFLRRKRDQVLKELPERTDNILRVPMTPEQRAPYEDEEQIVARIIAKWKRRRWISEIDRKRLTCALTNMRMLCDSTYLYDKETHFSPKCDELRELLGEICLDNGDKVVIFSQWVRMLEKIKELCAGLGIPFLELHGKIPPRKRRVALDQFREDPHFKCFLSSDAGGVGLNLQAASTVINVDIPWNPAVLEQRIARVHRLGQHRSVRAINLITQDSIEERILTTLSLKRALFDGLFDGTATEVDFSKLGKEKFMEQVAKLTELKGVEHKPHLPGVPPPAAPDEEGGRVADETDLLTAGVNLLEALTRTLITGGNGNANGNGKSPARSTTKARQAARELGAGQALEKALADRAATWVRQDERTGRTTLQIPIPSDEVVTRGARVLGQALGALMERFGGGGG